MKKVFFSIRWGGRITCFILGFLLCPAFAPTPQAADYTLNVNTASGPKNGQTVDGSLGIQYVGDHAIFDAGVITNTTIINGGNQMVRYGTSTTTTIEGVGSEQVIYSEGAAFDTTIKANGTQTVAGTAIGTIIDGYGGIGGKQEVYSGGIAVNTVIDNSGAQAIYSGGIADITTIKDGRQTVYGTATNTIIQAGGFQEVESTGTADTTTIKEGGRQGIFNGGTSKNITVEHGGIFDIEGGGATVTIAGNNIVKDGGKLLARAGETIILAGTDTSLIIERGNLSAAELITDPDPVSHLDLDNIFAGDGSLIKTGTGTLNLNGANTYTGLTEIRGGTLALTGTGNILSSTVVLYGGSTFAPGSAALNNLSRLDVQGATTSANWTGALNMSGKTMNFFIPSSTTVGSLPAMLEVTGTANITNSTVNVGIAGARSPLGVGDQIVLINASGGLSGNPANNTTNGTGMQGVTLKYIFDLDTTTNQLIAKVSQAYLNEQTKAVSEGFLSGVIMVKQGADLVGGKGMEEAVGAAKDEDAKEKKTGLAVFGALSGGWSRYNTGSHSEVSSINMIAGLSAGANHSSGRTTLGAFFEWGNGSYDTYNSFSNIASVKGNGDTYYFGGGLLGHISFNAGGTGSFYAEASIRAGSLHNEFNSSDMGGVKYDSSSIYYSFHLGAGHILKISEKASLDFYGKYFWTRVDDDAVTLSTGEKVMFKDVDSHRLRGGARFAYAVNEYVSPYIGAAYEHELDGKARATTNGFDIAAPRLKGGTGIGELGLTCKASAKMPLSFDLGVQGYIGKREGVTGSLQAKFKF